MLVIPRGSEGYEIEIIDKSYTATENNPALVI